MTTLIENLIFVRLSVPLSLCDYRAQKISISIRQIDNFPFEKRQLLLLTFNFQIER